MELKSVKEILESRVKNIDENFQEPAPVTEAVIKYIAVDTSKITNIVIEALENADEIFKSVRISEDNRNICVTDADDLKYNIWISQDNY